jgi:hypothetical protein
MSSEVIPNTKKPCNKEGCAGYGTFEGYECPGSDDEDHHCVHCGELWWDDKGENCELCGDYWCPVGWQHTFIFLDSCEHNPNLEDISANLICNKCFSGDPKLHCDELDCDLNSIKVAKNYARLIKE